MPPRRLRACYAAGWRYPNRDQAVIRALGAMGTAAMEAVAEVALNLGHPDIMVVYSQTSN